MVAEVSVLVPWQWPLERQHSRSAEYGGEPIVQVVVSRKQKEKGAWARDSFQRSQRIPLLTHKLRPYFHQPGRTVSSGSLVDEHTDQVRSLLIQLPLRNGLHQLGGGGYTFNI